MSLVALQPNCMIQLSKKFESAAGRQWISLLTGPAKMGGIGGTNWPSQFFDREIVLVVSRMLM